MGNLGWYQFFTTASKKVGGPLNLAGLIFSCGTLLGAAGLKLVEFIQEKREQSKNSQIYLLNNNLKVSDSLEIPKETGFRVLDRDRDAVLVDFLGIDNNPYFVSYDLLKKNSDYI